MCVSLCSGYLSGVQQFRNPEACHVCCDKLSSSEFQLCGRWQIAASYTRGPLWVPHFPVSLPEQLLGAKRVHHCDQGRQEQWWELVRCC